MWKPISKLILLSLSIAILILSPMLLLFSGPAPLTVICLSTNSSYDAFVHVTELPDLPQLRTQEGVYLDLGYAYRFWGKDTFVLASAQLRCGTVIDPSSLSKLIGSEQFESAFVKPTNPRSALPQLLGVISAVLFATVMIMSMIVSNWLSERYRGKWTSGRFSVFIPDDYEEVRRDLRRMFGRSA